MEIIMSPHIFQNHVNILVVWKATIHIDNILMLNKRMYFYFSENILLGLFFLDPVFINSFQGNQHPRLFMRSQKHMWCFPLADLIDDKKILEGCFFRKPLNWQCVFRGIQNPRSKHWFMAGHTIQFQRLQISGFDNRGHFPGILALGPVPTGLANIDLNCRSKIIVITHIHLIFTFRSVLMWLLDLPIFWHHGHFQCQFFLWGHFLSDGALRTLCALHLHFENALTKWLF